MSLYGEIKPEFPAFGETPRPSERPAAAGASTVTAHPGRRRDLPVPSTARQIQTHRFLGAGAHHTFQKQWKKGRRMLQALFYCYVNNSAGLSV